MVPDDFESPLNASTPLGSECGAAEYPWPIIRTCDKQRMLFLYDSGGILANALPAQLTEELCADASDEVLARFPKSKSFLYEDITEITESVLSATSAKERDNPSLGSHYCAAMRNGERLFWKIPALQQPGPRHALRALTGERYRVVTRRRGYGAEVLLVLLAVLLICLGLFAFREFRAGFLIASAAPVIAAFVVGWAGRPKLLTQDEVDALERAGRAGKQKGSGAAFRSHSLGWILKIAGLAYVFLFFSPLMDPVRKFFDDLKQHNNQVIPLLFGLLVAPAPLLIWCGYRLCQPVYKPGVITDERAPILFLRPFADDVTTTLQPKVPAAGLQPRFNGFSLRDCHPVRLFRMLFNVGVDTSEESLVRYFQKYGPVIAIGRPGEIIPAPGAARMYLTDETWQEAIAREFERAQIVVIQPGTSEGVRWELEQIRHCVQPQRLLLCLTAFHENPQAYETLRALVQQTMGVELPRVVPFLRSPAFVYFDADWSPTLQQLSYRSPWLWSVMGDATDLNRTLQRFMEGIDGEPREEPRSPAWSGTVKAGIAGLGGGLLGTAVLLGFVFMIRYSALAFFPATFDPEYAKEQALLEETIQAPKRKLTGVSVPYEVELSDMFHRMEPLDKSIEHVRRSPDHRAVFQILAGAAEEDFSQIEHTRAQVHKQTGAKDAKVESTRTLSHAGLEWKEVRTRVSRSTGTDVVEVLRVSSSKKGSMMFLATLAEFPDSMPVYQKHFDDMFFSLKWTPPTR